MADKVLIEYEYKVKVTLTKQDYLKCKQELDENFIYDVPIVDEYNSVRLVFSADCIEELDELVGLVTKTLGLTRRDISH